MNNLRVAEIFCSVQGEGPCVGTPAIFLRLAGCNFDCKWSLNGKEQRCDTRWAKSSGKSMSIDQVLNAISTLREKYPVSTLIVTGGEPVLQAAQLRYLIFELRARNDIQHIDIESNGTIPKDCVDKPIAELEKWMMYFNHYIVSPKPQTSITDLVKLYRASVDKDFYLKFVLDDTAEFRDWILHLIEQLPAMRRENVYLMSAGTNAQELRERDKRTIEICKEADVRFSPRVHSYIWGLKKGV